MIENGFLAVDWGTTNLRAWVVDRNGQTLRRSEFSLGIGSLQPGEAARHFRDTVRPALDARELPAIMCGMIGSTLGWEVAPYLDCPADAGSLREALHRVDVAGPPVWIVPGLRAERPDGGPDVMRGEETQLFGWVAEDPGRRVGERLLCLPGTHAKWVRMVDGRIETFVTSMTGELFALLSTHSILRSSETQEDDAAFSLGMRAAGDGNALASRLFTARSRVVGGDMTPSQVESYLSGMLISAEAAAIPSLLGIGPRTKITLIGRPSLGVRYYQALASHGFDAEIVDGEEAGLTGMKTLISEMELS